MKRGSYSDYVWQQPIVTTVDDFERASSICYSLSSTLLEKVEAVEPVKKQRISVGRSASKIPLFFVEPMTPQALVSKLKYEVGLVVPVLSNVKSKSISMHEDPTPYREGKQSYFEYELLTDKMLTSVFATVCYRSETEPEITLGVSLWPHKSVPKITAQMRDYFETEIAKYK